MIRAAVPARFSKALCARFQREFEDLGLLVLIGLAVPAAWWLLMGWSPSRLLSGNDGPQFLFPFVHQLRSVDGAWTDLIYRAGVMGGTKLEPAWGAPPLHRLGAWLGLSTTAAVNLNTLGFQVIYAFLVCSSAVNLARLLAPGLRQEEESPLRGGAAALGLTWLAAFTPLLGWKLGYGHDTLMAGAFSLLSPLSIILAVRAKRVSAALVAMALLGLLSAFPSASQQLLLYCALFWSPVLLACLFAGGGGEKRLREAVVAASSAAALVLSGLLISLPAYWEMVRHARSSDAARALGSESVVYSYVTATLWDWLSGITWANELLPSGRETGLLHETNYPLGPSLLLLLLLPWRRARLLGVSLVAGVLVVLPFTMNIAPFSTKLPELLPLLQSFRVPQRAMLPFFLLLPLLAGAALLLRSNARARSRGNVQLLGQVAIAAAAAWGLYSLPGWPRELFAWAIALVWLILAWRKPAKLPPAWLGLVLLGGASLGAFRERLLPFPEPEAELTRLAPLAQFLGDEVPELRSPLTRTVGNPLPSALSANAFFTVGLSSLDGYFSPTRRFSRLLQALEGTAFSSLATYVQLQPQMKSFTALRQLYNVCCALALSDGIFSVARLGPTLGEAWFAQKLEARPSLEAVVADLHGADDHLFEIGKWSILVDRSDLDVSAVDFTALSDASTCSEASVRAVRTRLGGQDVLVQVSNAGRCPLVISMNYTSLLRAEVLPRGTTTEDQAWAARSGEPLPVFPAYGALAGVVVSPGAEWIRLSTASDIPAPWTRVASGAGWVIAALIFGWAGIRGGLPPAPGEQEPLRAQLPQQAQPVKPARRGRRKRP